MVSRHHKPFFQRDCFHCSHDNLKKDMMKIHWAPIEHGCFYSNRKRDGMSKRQELRVCENERVCKKDGSQNIYCIDLERYLITFCDISTVPTSSSSKSHWSSHTHNCAPPSLGIQLSLPPTISVCVPLHLLPPPRWISFQRGSVWCVIRWQRLIIQQYTHSALFT